MTTTELPLQGFKFVDTDYNMPTVYASELIERFKSNPYAFGVDNMASTGYYRVAGWAFKVPGLRHYIYRDSYGSLGERYAPNRTALRKYAIGKITILAELETI